MRLIKFTKVVPFEAEFNALLDPSLSFRYHFCFFFLLNFGNELKKCILSKFHHFLSLTSNCEIIFEANMQNQASCWLARFDCSITAETVGQKLIYGQKKDEN